MLKFHRAYSGPRADVVGHRRHDALLKDIIQAVRHNVSREELLTRFFDGIVQISTAECWVCLELQINRDESDKSVKQLTAYDQRGLPADRWQRFCQQHVREIPSDSIIHRVLGDDLLVDVWGSTYFEDEFDLLRPLFDVRNGGWLAGLRLPPATALHNPRAVFAWYAIGAADHKVPRGAEQDWRILAMFQHCYDMCGFQLRQAARNIIDQRQEVLLRLAPSILNHEINVNVKIVSDSVARLERKLRTIAATRDVKSTPSLSEALTSALELLSEGISGTICHLQRISHAVLSLTRRVEVGRIDPLAEIESALVFLQNAANRRSVRLGRVKRPRRKIRLDTDAGLLMHLVVNLVINAIEANSVNTVVALKDRPKVWIEVSWNPESPISLPFVLDVCDNGPGVPSADANRIFEAGVTKKPGGHGLGLTICRMIAGYLGGTITLFHAGDPTVFRLRLPEVSDSVADLEEELKREANQS